MKKLVLETGMDLAAGGRDETSLLLMGPQVHLGLLPTPSCDDAVAFGGSPVARLGMTLTFTG